MTTILLTGFEPFGGAMINPSWEAVRLVASRWDRPERLITAELPVAFGPTGERMRQLLAEHRPDLVVAAGLAGGRAEVTPERVAINVDDGRIPDNAGDQPIDQPIVVDGPAAYFSTLPVKAIVAALGEREIPGAVSNSAGTFLCNDVFYVLMHVIATEYPETRGGFVHIPHATEFAPDGKPSLPLATIAEALETTITVSLTRVSDLALVGGTEY
ncbi:MAG TPA: pyroglutamyl-peptidase I [Thermomicrobiales bacterium]|jgi:pyroglutamyl-peptidase|nr:pyroglutamyl-peptidase I [Thermomicrobiales bacterium]